VTELHSSARISIFHFLFMVLVFLLAPILGCPSLPATHAQSNAPLPAQFHAPVRFEFGGNAADIPAEFVGNRILLPVRINESKTSLFELDTAAAASSIDPGRLEELGLAPDQPPILNLPGVNVPLAALPAIPKKGYTAQVGHRYEGALGGDFFCCVVVEVNYWRQTVQLYDPSVYKYSGNIVRIPLTFHGGVPVMHAKFVVANGKALDADFVLDTGLDASVVFSESYAKGHNIFSSRWKDVPADDAQFNWEEGVVAGRLANIHIGPYFATNAIANVSRASVNVGDDPKIAGSIGGGILRRFNVIFDYPHQQMILVANIHIREDDREDMSGLTLIARGPGLRTFEVLRVKSGSPAASASIQKGDVIAAINDEPAADMTLDSIRNLFRQLGVEYKLAVERGGQTRQVTLKMRHLM
jgi:membrane-associated protease RseP (regulator of RpoE activity)